jgi:Protein of unknown function (DUF3780)
MKTSTARSWTPPIYAVSSVGTGGLALRNLLPKNLTGGYASSESNQAGGKTGVNPVSRLLGKELVLLAWAIEEAEPGQSASALANWQGLAPEERWWLYTMTAAQTGHAHRGRGRGWRHALRFALCENPTTTSNLAAAEPVRKVMLKRVRPDSRQSTLWRARLATPQGAPALC